MNIEEFLADQREKIQQDKNRIHSSSFFNKTIPKNLFPEDVDLNANSVEEELTISGKLSLGNGSTYSHAQKDNPEADVAMSSKDSKNAANEIHLLHLVTQDTIEADEQENHNHSRKSKEVSDSHPISFDKLPLCYETSDQVSQFYSFQLLLIE